VTGNWLYLSFNAASLFSPFWTNCAYRHEHCFAGCWLLR